MKQFTVANLEGTNSPFIVTRQKYINEKAYGGNVHKR